jgi:hypothetical protein
MNTIQHCSNLSAFGHLPYKVNVSDPKNLRIVIPGDLKQRWEDLTASKRISQQDAVEALVRFVIDQGDLAQSVIFGQVAATPEVMRIIYSKLEASRKKGNGGRDLTIGRVTGGDK